MAVKSIINSTNFSLSYKTGVSSDGEAILKSTSWKCNSTATSEDFFTLASAMAPLYPYGIFDVLRLVNSSLVEE